MSSTVAILITVASIVVTLNFVNKLKFVQYQSSSIKLYLARAGVGIIPVILISMIVFFVLALLK